MNKVPIPEKMEKFYGAGTMLHPDSDTVEGLLTKIPEGKVATVELLCQKMASDHGTNVTCPMRTGNIIKVLAESSLDAKRDIPFWRVIRNNHLLINSELTEFCSSKLEQEGWALEQTPKGDYKLLDADAGLHKFN